MGGSVFGYAMYLAFIFLPGIGLGELLSLWKEEDSLVERVAFAFGLGLAVDTVVLLVRTSGIFGLRGIDGFTVYGIIVAGLIFIAASVAKRRRLGLVVRPRAIDFGLSLLVAVLAAAVWLHFQKYPIFPEYFSADFQIHVQLASGLLSGSVTSIPGGILYYGVHLQLASSLLLAGGEALVTTQRTMALLVILSPLLFHLATSKLFSSWKGGLLAASIYSLSGSVWYVSVFNSGLYANFFGILASLFFVVALAELITEVRSLPRWAAFLLALLTLYFSHYSSVTLLPALLALPLIQLARRGPDVKSYLYPAVAAVAPGAVALVASPGLLGRMLSLASSGGGTIVGSTWASSALSFFPVLSYMALELPSDLSFVLLFVFSAICVIGVLRRKGPLAFLPLLWLAVLFAASPMNVSAWRFSFEALVPLTAMAALGVFRIVPRVRPKKRGTLGLGRLVSAAFVLLILLAPVLIGSWGEGSVSDSLSNTNLSASSQQEVYSAIYWLRDNTPQNSRYLSVSDWTFLYTNLFIGRSTTYTYFSSAEDAVDAARQDGIGYIIVTNFVVLPGFPGELFLWANFNQSSSLTLLYNTSDVRIYEVV